MNAVERLAAALREALGPDQQAILAADPHLAQDIEDGAALRRLAAAVPDGWEAVVRVGGWHKWPMVEVWDPAYPVGRDDPPQPRYISSEATIAQAADACREAIEAQR